MLLTHLPSFSITLGAGKSVDNQMLFNELEVVMRKILYAAGSSVTEFEQTNRLYFNLWALICNESQDKLPVSAVIHALGFIDPFDRFDEITWVMLHLACARCDSQTREVIYHRIYQWLCANVDSSNAMQARLFLLSQPNFTLHNVDAEVIVNPILASTDFSEWLALLSHPDFNASQHNCEVIKTNIAEILNSLERFVATSGIGQKEIKALLNNIVALDILDQIATLSVDTVRGLIRISRSIQNISPEMIEFLGSAANRLISTWELVLTEKQKDKLEKRPGEYLKDTGKELSAEALEKMEKDFLQEVARDIQNQFLSLIAIPTMLDSLCAVNQKSLKAKMNEVLKCFSTSFFRDLSGALWGTTYASPRACSDTSVDWLMSLDAFINLRFLSLDPTTLERILTSIFQSGDHYFIEKLFELNRAREDKPLFYAMTQLSDFSHVNVRAAITRLLQEPDFYIEDYDHHSSEAFKSLPQVCTVCALYCLMTFGEEAVNATDSVESQETQSTHLFSWLNQSHSLTKEMKKLMQEAATCFDPDTFAWILVNRYEETLKALLTQVMPQTHRRNSSAGDNTENKVYQTIEYIRELAKKARKKSEAAYAILNSSISFVKLEIFYRLTQYINTQQNAHLGNRLRNPKNREAKIAFLQCVLDDIEMLANNAYVSSDNAPYLWSVYVKVHNLTDETAIWNAEQKISVLNQWLNTVFHTDNKSKTAETIAFLPEDLQERIFAGVQLDTSSTQVRNIEFIWRQAFAAPYEHNAANRRAVLIRADADRGNRIARNSDNDSSSDDSNSNNPLIHPELNPEPVFALAKYPLTAKTTVELNAALDQLGVGDVDDAIIRALDYPTPFHNFDLDAWKKLHTASMKCQEKSRHVLNQWIYHWLTTADTFSENAKYARMFLVSQVDFNLQQANAHIIQPMLQSAEPEQLLLLLAHPGFSVTNFENAFLDNGVFRLKNTSDYSSPFKLNATQKIGLFNNIRLLNLDLSKQLMPSLLSMIGFFNENLSSIIADGCDFLVSIVDGLIVHGKLNAATLAMVIDFLAIPEILEALLRMNSFNSIKKDFFRHLARLDRFNEKNLAVITRLLQDRDIHISELVDFSVRGNMFGAKSKELTLHQGASAAFADLPSVKTAVQLAFIFNTGEISLLTGQEDMLCHPETLIAEINNRYSRKLKSPAASTHPLDHKRVKRVSELLQQIPVDSRERLGFDARIIVTLLQCQQVTYEHKDSQMLTGMTSWGRHDSRPTQHRAAFLSFLIKDFNTPPSVRDQCFMLQVYNSLHFSTAKDSAVATQWFNKMICDEDMVQALLWLPRDYLKNVVLAEVDVVNAKLKIFKQETSMAVSVTPSGGASVAEQLTQSYASANKTSSYHSQVANDGLNPKCK